MSTTRRSGALEAGSSELLEGQASAAGRAEAAPGGLQLPSNNGAAQLAVMQEERRVVTVLFADIVGFTALSERLDPEEVRELIATTHGKLVEAVTLYGGTVDKFIGDAIMALFGAPVAHGDDPVRAIHAALAMCQAMEALGQASDGSQNPQLQLRIGVNTGEVVAGSRDVGGYREYSVFGDVVNTAARLQTAADPGGILIGETTARAAQHAFRLQATDLLELRGKEQSVQSYRVLGAIHAGETEHPGSGRQTIRAPLVGRVNEIRRLRQRIQELARGRGQIVSVIGEHGEGKSRLVGEIRPHAEQLGLRWAVAHAPSYGESLSYRMFRGTVRELFGIAEEDTEEVAAGRLRQGLRELGVAQAYPHLAFVLGLPPDPANEAEFRTLSAQQIQRRAFDAVRQFIRALATRQPLVLVLEDLQWADPSSIDLLQHIMSLSD